VTNSRSNANVPSGWSQQDRRFGESIKQNLDTLQGLRGDKLDRAVTFRDLIDAGIVRLASGITNFNGNSSSIVIVNEIPSLLIPPAPTNLQASGAFQNIILTWDLSLYRGHSAVQVWRHTSDSISSATMVAQVSGFTGVFADAVGSGQTFYYWVRAVNQNDVTGPFNSSTGTQGQTAPDVNFLVTTLANAITTSELASSLSTPIAKIDPLETFTGFSSSYSGNSLLTRMGAVETTAGNAATSAQLTSEQTTRASADTAIASDVTSLTTTVSGNTTSISTQATSINGLEAQYTVKIDNNGAVAGYGLASTTTAAGNIVSEFIVNADRFAIMRGGSNTTAASVPFAVQASSTTLNGVTVPSGVYVTDAFIKNGSIVNAKIGNAAIDNAKIASLDAGKISSGKIATSRLSIDSNFLSVDGSDQLQLVTSNGSNGIKVENLSNDAVGTIHFANQPFVAAANAFVSGFVSYHPTFAQFTASTPYYSGPTTLPQLMQTTIHKDKIKETGDYQLDFGGVVIGSSASGGACAIVAEIEDSPNNSTWTSRYHLHTNSYSGINHILATMFSYGDIALTANKYVRITLYGYKVFVNNNPSGQNGFGNLFIRVFRIAKNT